MVGNAKMRYGGSFNLFKMIMVRVGLIFLKMLKLGTAKVQLRCYIVQKAKIRCGWGFLLLKMLKYVKILDMLKKIRLGS